MIHVFGTGRLVGQPKIVSDKTTGGRTIAISMLRVAHVASEHYEISLAAYDDKGDYLLRQTKPGSEVMFSGILYPMKSDEIQAKKGLEPFFLVIDARGELQAINQDRKAEEPNAMQPPEDEELPFRKVPHLADDPADFFRHPGEIIGKTTYSCILEDDYGDLYEMEVDDPDMFEIGEDVDVDASNLRRIRKGPIDDEIITRDLARLWATSTDDLIKKAQEENAIFFD